MPTNVVTITNVELKNNIWTLTKHVAQSANKTAGKIDAKIYGPIVKTNGHTVQLPPQPKPEHKASALEMVGCLVGSVLIMALIVIGVFTDSFKGFKWWMFAP